MRLQAIMGAAALLLSFGLLAGCAKNNDQAAGSETAGNRPGWGERRPDFGQPDRPSDISGLVKSVTGNSVTILKLDRPGRMASGTAETADGERSGANPGNFAVGTGGGRMMGQAGGRFIGRPGEMDEESRAEMLKRLKEMSSGEETVTIPVGIRMLKPDTASTAQKGQPSMAEATLTDIVADKMLQIWVDQGVTDRKVAEFVLITR
jgi:hypothetical protein